MIRGIRLKETLKDGLVRFDGIIRKDSLLLTLGGTYLPFSSVSKLVDPYSVNSIRDGHGDLVENWTEFILNPLKMVLFSTAESIQFNKNHYGLMTTLSHVARLGLMSQPASFFIDPNYSGCITIEIVNFSTNPILLRKGMPIAKVIVFGTQSESHRYYERINQYYGDSKNLMSRFPLEFNFEGDANE